MRSVRSSIRKSRDGGRTARTFRNSYEDDRRAAAYSSLDSSDTYHLAFRDLSRLIAENAKGKRALDFGCGAGRSTRFLKNLGLDVVGIDISLSMIRVARRLDPEGDYRHVREADFSTLEKRSFDLVLSAFTFDNIPEGKKVRIIRGLRDLLRPSGRIINLVSSPDMYTHEWASFSTKDYPENWNAASGDVVRIITTAYEDSRPVEDILCTDESYRRIYRQSRLAVLDVLKPLAKGSEPFDWIDETRVAPWTIYVLGKKQ